MEKKPTNRGKMSNKRCIRARLQYLQHSKCYKASEATSWGACFTLAVFLADLLDSPFRCFVWITKFTFPQLTPIIAQVLKGKLLKIIAFAHSQTTNKLVNKAANNSARVSRQDGKKLPALPTNQIAGFGGFRPLASLEKINDNIVTKIAKISTMLTQFNTKQDAIGAYTWALFYLTCVGIFCVRHMWVQNVVNC